MIALIILLVLSIALNVFFVVYLRWLLKKLSFLSESIGDLLTSISGFSKHLESIHELETFYGDTALKNLIVHSKQIVRDVEIYKEIYTLFHDDENIDLEKLFEREGLYVEEEFEEIK
tara:strand:+ start:91 stop:441 length:351 start_codon:yes stop_codon:yes gene_type:complete